MAGYYYDLKTYSQVMIKYSLSSELYMFFGACELIHISEITSILNIVPGVQTIINHSHKLNVR